MSSVRERLENASYFIDKDMASFQQQVHDALVEIDRGDNLEARAILELLEDDIKKVRGVKVKKTWERNDESK